MMIPLRTCVVENRGERSTNEFSTRIPVKASDVALLNGREHHQRRQRLVLARARRLGARVVYSALLSKTPSTVRSNVFRSHTKSVMTIMVISHALLRASS
jgi:hypothetical protein